MRNTLLVKRGGGFDARKLRLENLEPRLALSSVTMTDYEQLLIELINRARSNPLAEVARNTTVNNLNDGLSPGSISSTPKQPLAPHQALINAAGNHSQDMLNQDYFSHFNLAGQSPTDRAIAAGYPTGVGENIAWGGQTNQINQIDHVFARHNALFASPGHRQNIMGEGYREIGAGVRFGVFTSGGDWNASMVTENFGNRGGNPFITGVAYDDATVDDNFYSVGEGVGALVITATNNTNGAVFSTTTGSSGGYSLQVPNGSYTVTASGTQLSGDIIFGDIVVSSQNEKVDFVTSSVQPPPPPPPPPPTPTIGVGIVSRSNDVLWQAESTGSSLVNVQWGNWSSQSGWSDTQTGDFDGDGRDDLVGRSNGQWWVGRSTGDSFTNEHWGTWSTQVQWKNVMVGDLTGDGRDDIVGQTPGGTWWAARSTGSGFVNERWGKWSNRVTWNDVHMGDFNGDGRDDIVGRTGNGSLWVAKSEGTDFTNQKWGNWSDRVDWKNVITGDFNGDGFDDIAGRAGSWWIAISDGVDFQNQRWGAWSTKVNWSDVQSADVDGDGRDDILGRAGRGLWVARSGGANFTNQFWGTAASNLTNVRIVDIDNNDQDDVVGTANGNWWVGQSNGNQFTTGNWGLLPSSAISNVLVGEFG